MGFSNSGVSLNEIVWSSLLDTSNALFSKDASEKIFLDWQEEFIEPIGFEIIRAFLHFTPSLKYRIYKSQNDP